MLEQLWIPHLSPYLAAGPNTTLFTRPDHLTGLQCRLIFRGTWAAYVSYTVTWHRHLGRLCTLGLGAIYLHWSTLELGANRALILRLKHQGEQKKRSKVEAKGSPFQVGATSIWALPK